VVARLFGAAAERAGRRQVEVGPATSVRELVNALGEQIPQLRDLLARCMVAVNREYAALDTAIHEGDEVAIIPPVSGGGPFSVGAEPLTAEPLIAAVTHPDAGAVVVFYGKVRASTGDWRTAELWYEAYPEMAVAEMERIGAEMAARWPGVRLAAAHRVGRLLPGEDAVIVAASAPHRGEAFAAGAAAMDAIKTSVPIWKKEISPDGRSFWVEHA
jgi:molybdopterin converting factor subunit 1